MRARALLVAAIAASCLRPDSLHAHPGAGIVVDAAGRVYFVVLGESGLMRLSPDGVATPFVTDHRLRFPHHLVIGPDGALYSASDHDGIVWRVAGDGSIAPFFRSGMYSRRPGAGGLAVGMGGDPFTIDASGRLYAVGRSPGRRVIRIGPDSALEHLGNGAMGSLHFGAMFATPDGSLYVTDDSVVWRVDRDTARIIVQTGLEAAVGIAMDPAGNLVVADYRDGRIRRFDANGRENTPDSFRRLRVRSPTGVTFAGPDLYVLDTYPGGTAIWRLRGESAERLYVLRQPGAWIRRALSLLPLVLVALLVARAVQRRRAAHAAA